MSKGSLVVMNLQRIITRICSSLRRFTLSLAVWPLLYFGSLSLLIIAMCLVLQSHLRFMTSYFKRIDDVILCHQ